MDTLTMVTPAVKWVVGLFTVVVGGGVIGVALLEWRHWRSGRTMIDNSQLGLRLAGAGLLLIILGMIFFGVFFAEIIQERPVFLSFWTVCMALAAMLFIIAIVDLRRLAQTQKLRQAEVYEEFARVVREEVARRSEQAVASETPSGGASPEHHP